MTYLLRAVVGRTDHIRSGFPGRPIVELTPELVLLPIDDPIPDTPVGRFYWLSPDLEETIRAVSAQGPIGYVEAEFFGGAGVQSSAVWELGSVVLGPFHTQTMAGDEEGFEVTGDMAINRALRRLGVRAADDDDEFSTAGMDRHRRTEDWVADEKRGQGTRGPG
jgi:hypothetical protein